MAAAHMKRALIRIQRQMSGLYCEGKEKNYSMVIEGSLLIDGH